MLSERERQLFEDIRESISIIAGYVGDMTFDQLSQDAKTKDAVERRLLIVSEAAIRLGETAPQIFPDIDWRGFRGMGNRIRHQYDNVDAYIVWVTLRYELPALRTAMERALGEEIAERYLRSKQGKAPEGSGAWGFGSGCVATSSCGGRS